MSRINTLVSSISFKCSAVILDGPVATSSATTYLSKSKPWWASGAPSCRPEERRDAECPCSPSATASPSRACRHADTSPLCPACSMFFIASSIFLRECPLVLALEPNSTPSRSLQRPLPLSQVKRANAVPCRSPRALQEPRHRNHQVQVEIV